MSLERMRVFASAESTALAEYSFSPTTGLRSVNLRTPDHLHQLLANPNPKLAALATAARRFPELLEGLRADEMLSIQLGVYEDHQVLVIAAEVVEGSLRATRHCLLLDGVEPPRRDLSALWQAKASTIFAQAAGCLGLGTKGEVPYLWFYDQSGVWNFRIALEQGDVEPLTTGQARAALRLLGELQQQPESGVCCVGAMFLGATILAVACWVRGEDLSLVETRVLDGGDNTRWNGEGTGAESS